MYLMAIFRFRFRLIVLLALLSAPFPVSAFDFGSLLRHRDQEEKFQGWLVEGRALRQRRLWDAAITTFNRILDSNPFHEEATSEMALTYFEARRWAEAADWYYALSEVAPQRRQTFSRRWNALFQLAGRDSSLLRSARSEIHAEIVQFLVDYPWDWETLAAAREGALTIEDSAFTSELTSRLTTNFPDSPAGYDVLIESFYDGLYSIWNDPAKRLPYIHDFLSQHPLGEYRETVWTYAVSAAFEAADTLTLRQAFRFWMAEDPDNPLPYERYVRYLIERGADPDSLLPVARQAVDLNVAWRGKPLKHVEQRVMEGKTLYANTRLNMGRVLLTLNRFGEARLWLEEGLKHSGFGVDDEGTVASFEYFLGVISEKESQWSGAFDHYIQALMAGDARGDWTARADSALRALYAAHFAADNEDLLSLARSRSGYNGPIFDDVTQNMGLAGVGAGRVAWGDANGDGYDDLLLNGWRLWLNDRGMSFREVTDSSGLRGDGVIGGIWADADLDGRLDLFCAANGQGKSGDRLYLNRSNDAAGIPRFEEATQLAGVISDSFPTEGAAWGDLQGDGRPDLYVANYEKSGPVLGQGTPDFLYLNIFDPVSPLGFHFERLGPDSGLIPPFGENLCGRGVNWGDFDGDGDQDIYVSNYRLQENFLWENRFNHLQDRACYYGVAGSQKDGWWGHTIGSEWGDFNNDGNLDLITANLAHPRYLEFSNRTCLYENRLHRAGRFQEVRADWNIKYEETHSDPAFGDVDNDGDLDLYLTSIYPHRRSYLYLNDLPDRQFRDATWLAGVRVSNAWGCAYSDFDGDGDLDLVVGSSDGVHLLRNRGSGHHWLQVEVNSSGSAYGTRLTLKRGREIQMREIQGGKGTTSQHSHVACFGLGSNPDPVTLEVRFPSGEKLKLKKIRLDQKLVIAGDKGLQSPP
jgi:tetratricopeptide (TPR) repeat protein